MLKKLWKIKKNTKKAKKIFFITSLLFFIFFSFSALLGSNNNFKNSLLKTASADEQLDYDDPNRDPNDVQIDETGNLTPDQIDKINETKRQIEENKSSGSWWNIFSWIGEKIYSAAVRAQLVVLYALLWIVYAVAYAFVMLTELFLGAVLNPDLIEKLGGFTTAKFVIDTAQLLANLVNTLFIFVFLYIAFSTIFGTSGNYKNLLFKLVVIALLVNFSLVLAGVIIDFSQVIMYTIAKNNELYDLGTKILKELEEGLKVGKIVDIAGFAYSFELEELLPKLISMILLIFFALILAVTIVVYAIYLIIRIVGLWILLILSPLAFFCLLLPQTSGQFNKWFGKLTNYAFLGPILIFFLWLAKKVASFIAEKKIDASLISKTNSDSSGGILDKIFQNIEKNLLDSFAVMFRFFVLVIILWAGIIVANSFKIAFSDKISSKWQQYLSSLMRGRPISAAKTTVMSIIDWRLGRREKQVELLGLDPRRKVEYEQKKAKLETKEKRREKWSKVFAVTSPKALKTILAEYIKKTDKKYWGDLDKAVKSFASTEMWGDRKGQINLGGEKARTRLEAQNEELRDLARKLRKLGLSDEEKAEIIKKINLISSSIAEKVTEDKEEQKEIINKTLRIAYDPSKDNILEEVSGEMAPSRYKNKRRYLFEEVIKNARKEVIDETSKIDPEGKLKEKQDKIREKEKEIDESGEDFAETRRRLERLEGDMIDKTARIRKLAKSDKEFTKFLKNTVDKFGGDIEKAIEHLKDNFSETEVIGAFRAAGEAAKKTFNLSATGLTFFDPYKDKIVISSPGQREDIITKKVREWDTSSIGKLDPQIFKDEDEEAIRAFAKGTNWKSTDGINMKNFKEKMKQSTREAFQNTEYRNKMRASIDDPNQLTAFDNFMNEMD